MKRRIWIMASAFIMALPMAYAQESPGSSTVHNSGEKNSLRYTCTKPAYGLMECDFVQVSVRNQAKPEELAAELAKARESFESDKQSALDGCAQMIQTHEVLNNTSDPEVKEKIRLLDDITRVRLVQLLEAYLPFCKSKALDDYLRVTRVYHSHKVKSCKISSNTFSQSFKFVSGANPIWVVKSEPDGECGAVRLDRFESEDSGFGVKFWKYVSKKAVLNPKGIWIPGSPPAYCSDMDTEEYLFDWRSKEWPANCETVSFQ